MSLFEDLLNEYLDFTASAHGMLVRPNDTFYAHAVVSESLAWLRGQVMEGRRLNAAGERLVAGAACYLAYIAYQGFKARGLAVGVDADWEPGNDETGVALVASREREGMAEQYGQDFFLDTARYLMNPPEPFPVMHGAAIFLKSLTLITPEYLYMLGTHFLSWPDSAGNWPRGEKMGGIDEDFAQGRELLISELHRDLGLPDDDPAFRALSNWIVWPPYGWDRNDVGQYNLMTIIDQVAIKRSVSGAAAGTYLRHLLRSQVFNLRLIAARALLVLGAPPADPLETLLYTHAVNASDFPDAFPHLARFRWQLDGHRRDVPPTPEYTRSVEDHFRSLIAQGPREPWRNNPALRDPDYGRLRQLPPEAVAELAQGLTALEKRYPGDWFVQVARAHFDLRHGDPVRGEASLVDAFQATPGDSTAHFTLGTWLVEQKRWDEARSVFFDAVSRWPWDPRAVGNAFWIMEKDMVD